MTQVRRDRRFVFSELLADVFETGERLDTAKAKFISNRLLKIRGDKCFNDHPARAVGVVENSKLEKLHRPIPCENRADLVAGDELHLPLGIPRRNTHAIIIRIGCNHEIRSCFIGLGNGHGKGFGIFRVRRFNGWEPTIWNLLLNDGIAMKAEALKHGLDNHSPHAVKRGVNNFE